MINEAIKKITEEMMKINDPVAQGIEEYLTGICTTESVAQKILDPSKKLEEIHRKVWDEAKRRKKGNCAFIPEGEVYEMVRKYYGIGEETKHKDKVNVLDLL